jgi:hypothetical protein
MKFLLQAFGFTLATNLGPIKEVSMNFLRTIPVNSAVEKIYLVDRVEDILTELALPPYSHTSFESRAPIMEAFTAFVEFILNSDDINEKRINDISWILEDYSIWNLSRGLEERDQFSSVLIEISQRILITTGIDMLLHIPDETIPNQALIQRLVDRISKTTTRSGLIRFKNLASLPRVALEHMDDLSMLLLSDCHRMIASNPGRVMHCYPMYSLLEMDVSTLGFSDVFMGPELEQLEAMVSDFCTIKKHDFWLRNEVYKQIIAKRKVNPQAVSEVLREALQDASKGLGETRLYYGIENMIDRIEELVDPPNSDQNGHIDGFVDPRNSDQNGHIDGLVDPSHSEAGVEDLPVERDIARMVLDAVLTKLGEQSSRYPSLALRVGEWIPEASSYEIMALVNYLISPVNHLISPFDAQEDRFGVGLAQDFNILLSDEYHISLLGTGDPGFRKLQYELSANGRASTFINDEGFDILNRYRRISFGLRGIVPYVSTLYMALAVQSDDELVGKIIDRIDDLISESPTIVDLVFTGEIPAMIADYTWGVEVKDTRIQMQVEMQIVMPENPPMRKRTHFRCFNLISRIPVMMKILGLNPEVLMQAQIMRETLVAVFEQVRKTQANLHNAHEHILYNICARTFEWIPGSREISVPSLDQILASNQQLRSILLAAS